jgi:hypothetical protein
MQERISHHVAFNAMLNTMVWHAYVTIGDWCVVLAARYYALLLSYVSW